jgi:hypothetical protein
VTLTGVNQRILSEKIDVWNYDENRQHGSIFNGYCLCVGHDEQDRFGAAKTTCSSG